MSHRNRWSHISTKHTNTEKQYHYCGSNIALFIKRGWWLSALDHVLDEITDSKRNVILLGDINISRHSYMFATQAYMTVRSGHKLQKLISPETRHNHCFGTVIAHFIMSFYSAQFTSVTISTDITDHESVFLFCRSLVDIGGNVKKTCRYSNYTRLTKAVKN